MLGLKERPGIGNGTAWRSGMPCPAVVVREDAWKVFSWGKPCVLQSTGTDASVLVEPMAALLLPIASAIYSTGFYFALGYFQRVEKDVSALRSSQCKGNE